MAQINKPNEYFNTVLYTGNGSTGHAITGVGFQPDWLWIKERSSTSSHFIYDVIRGVNVKLSSNTTDADSTVADSMTSFDSDGFTVGNNGATNENGQTVVAWNWLASNTTASNTDGSITSTVSVNTTSGFSIVSYTGTGSVATVGHGLGVTPKIFIVKNRTSSNSWSVYSSMTGNGNKLLLNTTDASSSSGNWNSTSPTSSVFTINGGSGEVGASGNNYIAYCFADVKGFSKFGSYIGNGNNSDGTFVYTGFKPAWIMVKRTDTAGAYWTVMDSVRSPYNEISRQLYPSIPDAEYDNGANNADFLSNGFKLYHSAPPSPDNTNASGGTYIYMAFAENPLVGTNNIPATAR